MACPPSGTTPPHPLLIVAADQLTYVIVVRLRAFSAETHLAQKTMQQVDRNMSVYLTLVSSSRWLSIRLEFLGGLMILAAAVFAVIAKDQLGGRLSGVEFVLCTKHHYLLEHVCADVGGN